MLNLNSVNPVLIGLVCFSWFCLFCVFCCGFVQQTKVSVSCVAYIIHSLSCHVSVCTVDPATPTSPSSLLSECPVLDCDRDTTFDDFDLENDERLEVTEMFHSSSDRDLARSRSSQGRHLSESEVEWTRKDNMSPFSIDIPSSFRHCRSCSFERSSWINRFLKNLSSFSWYILNCQICCLKKIV